MADKPSSGMSDLGMDKTVPQPVIRGNINIHHRPVVKNADGTVSTEVSFSIGTEQGEVLIPQVVNGKLVSQEEAEAHYRQTGEHLGIFKTPQDANAYAEWLHDQQTERYGPKQ